MYGRVRAFDEVAYRTVYAPVYLSCYEHNGTPYTFVLNGQTAACWGEKPLGFGVTRALAKLVTGSETSTATSVRVCRGAELNAEDRCTVYAPDAEYFVLPSSDQFIAAAATGYAELQNTSRASVTIRPQWRGSTKTAKTLTIRSNERLVFSFQYSWCLRIVTGSSQQIKFLTCVTSGGGSKPDPFGMVAPVVDGLDESALSLSAFVRADEQQQQQQQQRAPPKPLKPPAPLKR